MTTPAAAGGSPQAAVTPQAAKAIPCRFTRLRSQRPFADAAAAIIDCLMHHCTAIAINDESCRLKEHKLKNGLTNNLQAAKKLKPERHNCRGSRFVRQRVNLPDREHFAAWQIFGGKPCQAKIY
ncbi:hypothetical protein [Sutterella wadsworthensis]|uniref:hypothetical protein n=1 Tax=Sutterella wadsworthensis TaxID=40545 RepID=UPI003966BE4A